MLRRSTSVITLVIVALTIAASATASNKSFDLTVVPQVTFVTSGNNVVVSYTVTNNTGSAATCILRVDELNFDAPLGTIAGGQSAGGQLSTPALYKNSRLTFNLICDGNNVDSRSVNIKVR